MTISIDKGFEILNETIQYEIFHEDYDRTVEIAQEALMMVTGENQDEVVLLGREKSTETQQEQIVALTTPVTPFVLNPVISLYERIFQVETTKKVLHEDDSKKLQIEKSLSQYYDGQGVDNYLKRRLLLLNSIDPNAWIITERKNILNAEGDMIEDVKPYPFEVTSKEARNYQFTDGAPVWLIVEQKRLEVVREEGDVKQNEVSDFFFYAAGFIIKYTEFKEQKPNLPGEVVSLKIFSGDAERKFVAQEFETGSLEFPGRKVGAYDSQDGNSSLKVPLFNPAMGLLYKVIKDNSRLDVSKDKHIFPREYRYQQRCNFQEEEGSGLSCIEGYLGGNKNRKCPKCSGTGRSFHYSELDVIEVALPPMVEDARTLPDLSKFVHSQQAPIDITQFISEQLEKERLYVQIACLGTIIEEQVNKPQTATEIVTNWKGVNIKVAPFDREFGHHFKLIHRIASQYLEVSDGFEVDYISAKDYKLMPLGVLFKLYEEAKNSNMGYEILWSIKCDIIRKLHIDEPGKIEEIKAREVHKPFKDKSDETIVAIIASLDAQDNLKILWEHWATINENITSKYPEFSKMTYERQKEIFNEETEEIKATLNFSKPDPLPDLFGADPDGEQDLENVQNAQSETE